MIYDWQTGTVTNENGTFEPELTRKLLVGELVVVDAATGLEIPEVVYADTTKGVLTRLRRDADGNGVLVPRFPDRPVKEGQDQEMWPDRMTEARACRVVLGEEWERELVGQK